MEAEITWAGVRGWTRQVSAAARALLAGMLSLLLVTETSAQVSVTGRGKNFVAPVTDAQGKKSVLRGKDVRQAGPGLVEISGMQAETFRGQEKDLVVEAPQCRYDTREHVASSAGPLSIRTADGRFSIQGEAFQWQMGDSRQNSRLVISNQVQALVRKRAIRAGIVSAPAGGRAQEAGDGSNEFIRITSREFDYQADRATFRGDVRVLDLDGALASGTLTVVFASEDGTLERIEAEEHVVLDQNGTRAMADRAVYSLGEDQDLLQFFGRARWQDGAREGRGERLTFDRRTRRVRAEENAYLKAPRAILGESGLLPGGGGRQRGSEEPPSTQTSFVEVFSDLITIQLPQTNGPVQQIIAEKNVLIIDPQQHGRALADRAVYDESTGVLELTGAPFMETDGRLVNGRTLRFNRATRTFTAGPDAYIKLPLAAVLEMGVFPGDQPGSARAAQTNQFVEIWSRTLEYQTNVLRFRDEVRANFLEGDVARGELTCRTLTVSYADHVQSILAEGEVELEQYPRPGDPGRTVRRLNCNLLRARFDSVGRLELAVAEGEVIGEQEEVRPDQPAPVVTALRAPVVTAHFSPATNRFDRMVAEDGVVFAQGERVAHGARAVYTEQDGKLVLTGQPRAVLPEGRIDRAERLIWERALNRFYGQGKFKSEWKRTPPGERNRVTGTAPATE